MSVSNLIAEAKQLLAKAEHDVKDVIEHVDPTQLRVAVHRLGLFHEHVAQVVADPPELQESEVDDEPDVDGDELATLTRKELNQKAAKLGVEDPAKLPNKDAVIAAIREAGEPEGAGDEE